MIAGISHKQCQWLALRAWWHAPAFGTHEITWRRAYVAWLSPLLWKNWYNCPLNSTLSCSLLKCEWNTFIWETDILVDVLLSIFSGNVLYPYCYDDIIKWKHFPRYWPFVRGIQRSPVNSTHKGQWRGALMFSLICAWINTWVNNRYAGDLRHHRGHNDGTVMV